MLKVKGKRGQLSIYIIIAIVIVAIIAGYFLLRERLVVRELPAEFKPVEEYFLGCIEGRVESGVEILGERAGYIYPPEFEPGNEYSPFSSQLDFFGSAVPYWYYISANNLVKEQVPSKSEMEEQLERYLVDLKCDFSDFEKRGFIVDLGEIKAEVDIKNNDIDVSVKADLDISFEEQSARITTHDVNVKTRLGNFYDLALNIYNKEKQEAFLEQYAVDVLRLYAPVDGVEISCAPKIWIPQEIVSELQEALEANIQAIKLRGDYYRLSSEENRYFVVDMESDESVNFIYNRDWPSRIEIWPVEADVMIAEPVGLQEGLGVLGFCYVPYHFVYDWYFPVLIQVHDNKEMFQFPVAVVINKNVEREALPGHAVLGRDIELCQYRNTEVIVYTYDTKLNPVEADIDFKCFDTACEIGETRVEGGEAVLSAKFPQCVNGFIIAKAEGYVTKKHIISTNQPGIADVILDKLYDIELEVKIDGKEPESAIVYFTSIEHSATALWPEQKSIKLSEGLYNVTLQVYGNSSLVFPSTTRRKCVEVPSPGLLGLFGRTREQCFDIEMPSQTVTSVLIGGGKTQDYFTEDRLERGKLEIIGQSLDFPKSLEDLGKNYELFETKTISVV